VVALSFRLARGDDVPAVGALVDSAFRGDPSRGGRTTEADLLDGQRTDEAALASIVESANGAIVIAEDGADVVGCCQLERRPSGSGYVGMVSVSPWRQASGIGRALVVEAERRAVEFGARRMQMTVLRQRSELIAWYERLGYRLTGETQPFPYGDERFGVPKVADLEFVVLEKSLT
jgi:predicted N-acetyltransferase YhbS